MYKHFNLIKIQWCNLALARKLLSGCLVRPKKILAMPRAKINLHPHYNPVSNEYNNLKIPNKGIKKTCYQLSVYACTRSPYIGESKTLIGASLHAIPCCWYNTNNKFLVNI
jgi:hypothetical protein